MNERVRVVFQGLQLSVSSTSKVINRLFYCVFDRPVPVSRARPFHPRSTRCPGITIWRRPIPINQHSPVFFTPSTSIRMHRPLRPHQVKMIPSWKLGGWVSHQLQMFSCGVVGFEGAPLGLCDNAPALSSTSLSTWLHYFILRDRPKTETWSRGIFHVYLHLIACFNQSSMLENGVLTARMLTQRRNTRNAMEQLM